jgi:hypothetical protein
VGGGASLRPLEYGLFLRAATTPGDGTAIAGRLQSDSRDDPRKQPGDPASQLLLDKSRHCGKIILNIF